MKRFIVGIAFLGLTGVGVILDHPPLQVAVGAIPPIAWLALVMWRPKTLFGWAIG